MVELAPISADDREQLREMLRAYWSGLMPHAPVVTDGERGHAYFEGHFRTDDPGHALWWAMLGSTRIGFARVELSADADGQRAYISDFSIASAHRRHGHGRSFARALAQWLAGRGAYRIDLHVREDNPAALAFWRAVGFQLASYRLRHYLALAGWP